MKEVFARSVQHTVSKQRIKLNLAGTNAELDHNALLEFDVPAMNLSGPLFSDDKQQELQELGFSQSEVDMAQQTAWEMLELQNLARFIKRIRKY